MINQLLNSLKEMVINLITYNLLFYEYKFLEKIVMSTNIFKFNDYKKR